MKPKTSKLFGALAFALIFAVSCATTAFAAGDPIEGTNQPLPRRPSPRS